MEYINIPNKSKEFVVSILLPSISIVCPSEFPNLFKIIDWNFSGLTIIFRLIQSTTFSDSFSKVVSSASFEEIVLSSAKLYISDFCSVVSRSFRNMLNKIGPKMEPCGTPEISD